MSIAEAVSGASTYLTEHPDEARYRDPSARAHSDGGLKVHVTGPGGESLTTDMPVSIGGTATAPSPGWFLRAATASCVTALVAMRAATLGIEIRSIDIEVDSESDDRGILGLDPAIPAGALSMRISVSVDAPGLEGQALDELARWAVDHCPVSDSVARAVPVDVEVA